VGWAADVRMRTSLCVRALQIAFWRRKPVPGLLHHSDRGSQYASHQYRCFSKNFSDASKNSSNKQAIYQLGPSSLKISTTG